MSRSLYKMPFVNQAWHAAMTKVSTKAAKHETLYARSSTITPDLIGQTVQIHCGHRFNLLKITPNVVGYKFGSFAPTKSRARYRKQKKNSTR